VYVADCPSPIAAPSELGTLHCELAADAWHSQPFGHAPSMLKKPGLQAVTLHADPLQLVAATCPTQSALHLLPQAPQLFTSFDVLISQPSTTAPLQLANPGLQLPTTQALAEQAGAPFATAGQVTPHPPQLFTLFVVLISQPSAKLPLQFAKPALQLATAQVLAEQVAAPFATAGQALLHPPQLFTLFVVLISQPSATTPLQFAKPGSQLATAHDPATQAAVPFAALHVLPQAPQLLTLVCVFTSQPSAGFPLQSAKPGLQAATTHAPAEQPAVPFAIEQTFPQPPQWLALVCVFTSQPSAGLPLQFAKPALQLATAQLPPLQPGVPFAIEQTFPQEPQSATLVCVFTSQPSATFPLQFSKPALQLATAQLPALQPGVPFATEQAFPQEPQSATLVCVFTSQPSAGFKLQSANGALQLWTAQLPALQTGTPFATAHAWPQPPQFASSEPVFTSQPSAGFELQSANGALQLPTAQLPALQAGAPFATAHTWPQPPQFATSPAVLISQPSAGLVLQSVKPGSHAAMAHTSPTHSGVPLATAQATPQPPQLATSISMLISQPSTGLVLQSRKPGSHAAMAHTSPTHSGVPLATAQATPQPPQLATSMSALISQPSTGLALQSRKPGSQLATSHAALTHSGVPLGTAHATPQPPQFASSVSVLTSQPSAGLALQSSNPALQSAIAQAPAAQLGVPLATAHAVPQPPQFATSVFVFTSQPSTGLPLQSSKPASQLAISHAAATQLGVPLATAHAVPQPPQFAGSVSVLTSQPSAGARLQSAKPASQAATVQLPPTQPGVPFATLHASPQPPQFAASTSVLTSHPSPAAPLQSANAPTHA
jgi:hypothetical protein